MFIYDRRIIERMSVERQYAANTEVTCTVSTRGREFGVKMQKQAGSSDSGQIEKDNRRAHGHVLISRAAGWSVVFESR